MHRERKSEMKHIETNEMMLPKSHQKSEEAEQFSNHVGDLMREKFSPSININITVGQHQEKFAEVSADGKLNSEKLLSEGMMAQKKLAQEFSNSQLDAQLKNDFSVQEQFKEDFTLQLPDTTSGDHVILKKDGQGNIFKVPSDGGSKLTAMQRHLEHDFLNT